MERYFAATAAVALWSVIGVVSLGWAFGSAEYSWPLLGYSFFLMFFATGARYLVPAVLAFLLWDRVDARVGSVSRTSRRWQVVQFSYACHGAEHKGEIKDRVNFEVGDNILIFSNPDEPAQHIYVHRLRALAGAFAIYMSIMFLNLAGFSV